MVNFTYNTRATILPDNMVPNGSIAVLIPKVQINKDDLAFYSTPEFRKYYEIVKLSTRYNRVLSQKAKRCDCNTQMAVL